MQSPLKFKEPALPTTNMSGKLKHLKDNLLCNLRAELKKHAGKYGFRHK